MGSCCAKPITKIIKVGDIDTGIIGLENALLNVYISGVDDEEQLKRELLLWIKMFGNYVSRSREEDYKQALLREYKRFCAGLQHEAKL
ncbi:MAG: hypothetical protein ACP5JH_04620 [Bacteroidota bacterium]